jgi:DNA helicase-2/ATP-dependent DNA helicase PcrA
MVLRLQELGITGVQIGTIHSLCHKILTQSSQILTMYRFDDRGVLPIEIKKILGEYRKRKIIPREGTDCGAVESFICECKGKGISYIGGDPFYTNKFSAKHMLACATKWAPHAGMAPNTLINFYHELEDRRAAAGLFDYDDMQLFAWLTLLCDSNARLQWRRRYGVVMIDEAQDNSPIQWDIARLLTGIGTGIKHIAQEDWIPTIDDEPHALMAGSDSCQSLYSWRAAEPSMLVAFAKRSDVQLITLPVNYRSIPAICGVATKLVEDKRWNLLGCIQPVRANDLHESCEKGIVLRGYATPQDEAELVVHKCVEIAQGDPRSLRSCAILSRLRVALDLAEIACVRRGIRYVKMAEGSFFDSREVQDVVAYLRVAADLDPQMEAAKRIINKPFRFISNAAINQAYNKASLTREGLVETLCWSTDILKVQQVRAMEKLRALLRKLTKMHQRAEDREARRAAELERAGKSPATEGFEETHDQNAIELAARTGSEGTHEVSSESIGPADMIKCVLRETEYIEELRREEGLVGMDESKIAALSTLHYMATFFKQVKPFIDYVDAVSVAVKQARKAGLRMNDESAANALVLSTIHRFKGLQARNVFLIDVNDKSFPHQSALDFDEELRLLYVAITRAQDFCQVSYSTPTDEDGEPCARSQFIFMLNDILEKVSLRNDCVPAQQNPSEIRSKDFSEDRDP